MTDSDGSNDVYETADDFLDSGEEVRTRYVFDNEFTSTGYIWPRIPCPSAKSISCAIGACAHQSKKPLGGISYSCRELQEPPKDVPVLSFRIVNNQVTLSLIPQEGGGGQVDLQIAPEAALDDVNCKTIALLGSGSINLPNATSCNMNKKGGLQIVVHFIDSSSHT